MFSYIEASLRQEYDKALKRDCGVFNSVLCKECPEMEQDLKAARECIRRTTKAYMILLDARGELA